MGKDNVKQSRAGGQDYVCGGTSLVPSPLRATGNEAGVGHLGQTEGSQAYFSLGSLRLFMMHLKLIHEIRV